MQIRSARIFPVRLPLRTPLETAHGTLRERHSLILEVSDADGRRGYGEAAPIAGFPGESFAGARAALDAWSARPRAEDVAWAEHPVAEAAAPADSAALQRAPIARAAVATALLDLAARARGVPLAAHLLAAAGAEPVPAFERRRSVPVNALLGAFDPQALAEAGQRAVADGFRTVKVKVGAGALQRDCERLRALRAAIGPEIRLRADANAAWQRGAALRACEALAPFELEWLEQPVAAEPLSELHAVAERTRVPIAADESAAAARGALDVIAAGKCRALILKPALLGGPHEAVRLAALAFERGMAVAVTTLIDSAIGRAMALHVAAAGSLLAGRASHHLRTHANVTAHAPDTAHGLVTAGLLGDDVCHPEHERSCAGTLELPAAPGLGVAPEPEALERLRWEQR